MPGQTPAPGPSVERQIVDFFMAKGLSRAAAAGIAGNVAQESSFDPNAPGGGLFQDIGGRGAGQGASVGAQLDKAWAELKGPYSGVLRQLQAPGVSPGRAARIFSEGFERPGVPNLPHREAAATSAYERTRGGTPNLKNLYPGEEAGINLIEEGVEGPVKAAEGAASAVTSTANFLKALTEPTTWLRIAEGIGGTVLFMVGLKTLTRGSGGGALQEGVRQTRLVKGVGVSAGKAVAGVAR